MDGIATHVARLCRRSQAVLLALLRGLLAFGLLACGLAPRVAGAQPDTTRWTPGLTMRYDQITETEISPSGEHVAYVVREAIVGETTSEFRQQIHVAAVEGSSDVQYTRGEHSSFHPRWSPSGDRIAFLSARGGGAPQVYLMRLQGGEPYPVTGAETGVNSFQWGPDGERIAYVATDPKSEAEKQREKEKRDVNVVNEEFRYDHLYTTEVKPAGDTTRTVQRLTEGAFHVTEFDWSPSGETIAFVHQPTPRIDDWMERDLSTVPADSGAVEPLVERPGYDGLPHYSPDGETVAFVSMGGKRAWHGLEDVYTVPAEGGDPTALARTPNRLVWGNGVGIVGWTAGGESVLVDDAAGTSYHIYAVGEDSARQVTAGEGVYEDASYSRSAGRLALTYQNSTAPEEVYVGPRSGFERRQVTTVNEEVPRPEMGRTELVTWTGPEGQEIEGLLTYPIGYDGGRVPLILDIHGGPIGTHLRTFMGDRFTPYKVFAERGYATLRPNPRGSSGYGLAFREAVIEDWGGVDYEDLMAGVDKTVEMGVAHPDSLAIMGWSYGGYMTAWAVTQTDRFEAANMGAGLSNLISDAGTTDIPEAADGHMGGPFWNRYEFYEERSPIYHVKSASTPTQILHGAEDELVAPSQGREFYRALRGRGVETKMVLYPRSPHVPQEPKQTMDIPPRIIDWFDEHLGRPTEGSGEAPPEAAESEASSGQ